MAVHAQRVLELGTRNGVSTEILVQAVKQTGGHVWTLDMAPKVTSVPEVDAPYLTFLQGHSLKYTPEVPYQVIFLDTSHQYEATLLELEHYWSWLDTPGLLLCHDYDSHFGCKRAITEWAGHHNLGFIADSRGQGMAIFEKPSHQGNCRSRLTFDRWTTLDVPIEA